MKIGMTGAAVLIALMGTAQDTTNTNKPSPLTISGYAEAYYSFDLNKPTDNNRPAFLYSHNRHNEFTANLAFIKASYNTERVRANVALAAGTYINANYAAEPGVLKNILEANAGYKLSTGKNLWFDIGIIPSHIGFESAVSKDCWALTRSLMAENSPYYESGARLTYGTSDGKWTFSALALNGWQRIKRVDGNSMMSWGSQVTFKPAGRITINYSTFYGSDKPDSTRQKRLFHNVYGIFQFSDKWGLTAGFDIGTEQKIKGSSEKNTWYSPVGILRFTPTAKWAFAVRGEYYDDENGVIIATGTPNGFKISGVSFNADYLPVGNLALRLEGRWLKSRDEIFSKGDVAKDNTTAVTFSAAVSF